MLARKMFSMVDAKFRRDFVRFDAFEGARLCRELFPERGELVVWQVLCHLGIETLLDGAEMASG
jgi:hypothetical protein